MKSNVKTIVVCGKTNSGKTTVIRNVTKYLIDEKGLKPLLEPNFNKKDIRAVLQLPDHKTLGIVSCGDGIKYTKEHYDKIPTCDFYLGAGHTYGEIIEFYSKKQKSENGYHDFCLNSTLFIRKIKGCDDNTKGAPDDPIILESNGSFEKIIEDLLTYYFAY